MNVSRMSEAEFLSWSPRSRASYAKDKMKAHGFTQEQAEKTALDDFNRLLPDGLNSKDNFLFTAKDSSQNVLGFIWFCIRGTETNKRAFICDFLIEENYRGNGYGKQLMLHIEKEVKSLGINRIGLHVFGFNETAIRLYQSLGYLTTDLQMEKSLPN